MASVSIDPNKLEEGELPIAPHGSGAILISNVATSFTFYPLVYARSLMQVGYEPLLPVEGKTAFGSRGLFYPNVFGYVKHMANQNGFASLWTGYSYRLTAILISSQVEPKVSAYFEQINPSENPTDSPLQQACKKCANDVGSKVTITVALYPLQLLTYRAIVATIGGEQLYKAPLKAVREILKSEGLLGFYSGLLPTIISEGMGITIVHALNYLFTRYVAPHFELEDSMTSVVKLIFAVRFSPSLSSSPLILKKNRFLFSFLIRCLLVVLLIHSMLLVPTWP